MIYNIYKIFCLLKSYVLKLLTEPDHMYKYKIFD